MELRPKRMLLNCHLLSRARTVCCHPLLGSQHLTHSCAVKFYSTELQIHRKTFSNTGCLLCFSFSSELPLFSRTGHLSVLKMQWPWEQNLVPSLLPKLCLEKWPNCDSLVLQTPRKIRVAATSTLKGGGYVRRTRLVPRLYPSNSGLLSSYSLAWNSEASQTLNQFPPLLSPFLTAGNHRIKCEAEEERKRKKSVANHLVLHGFNLNPPSKSAPWEEFRMKNRMRHSVFG